MKLEELGQLIAKKREERGMSVEEVAGIIKVSARMLRTIEEGSLQGLPHAVYTKGFIRSYGMLVGIDAEELNVSLKELFPPEAFDDAAPQLTPMLRPVYASELRRRFLGIVVLLALLVGLITGGWFVYSQYGGKLLDLIKQPFSAVNFAPENTPLVAAANGSTASSKTPYQATTQTITESSSVISLLQNFSSNKTLEPEAHTLALTDETLGREQSAGYASSELMALAPSSAESAPVEYALPITQVAESPATEPSVTEVIVAENASIAPTVTLTEQEKKTLEIHKNIVFIDATEDCYLGITADNKNLEHYFLKASTSRDIVFTTSLKLLVGNAGGIKIRYNGKDMGVIGEQKKPKLLAFPL